MSENSTSQSQHEAKPDPLKLWMSGLDAWAQLTRDGIERLQSLYAQFAELEEAAYQQTKKSAREIGDRVSESVTCFTELGREWRKFGIEAARRSAQAFRPEL